MKGREPSLGPDIELALCRLWGLGGGPTQYWGVGETGSRMADPWGTLFHTDTTEGQPGLSGVKVPADIGKRQGRSLDRQGLWGLDGRTPASWHLCFR
jgi:hypothetical protein